MSGLVLERHASHCCSLFLQVPLQAAQAKEMANLMFNLLGFGFACCFRMARWPVARHVSFGAFTEASRQLGFLPERSHQQFARIHPEALLRP